MKTITLHANLQWRAHRSDKSNRWIGVCDAMNLAMEADTLDELHSVIDETLQTVLLDLLEDDELEAYLRQRGWTAQGIPASPERKGVAFLVPWELIAEGSRGSERRAS